MENSNPQYKTNLIVPEPVETVISYITDNPNEKAYLSYRMAAEYYLGPNKADLDADIDIAAMEVRHDRYPQNPRSHEAITHLHALWIAFTKAFVLYKFTSVLHADNVQDVLSARARKMVSQTEDEIRSMMMEAGVTEEQFTSDLKAEDVMFNPVIEQLGTNDFVVSSKQGDTSSSESSEDSKSVN